MQIFLNKNTMATMPTTHTHTTEFIIPMHIRVPNHVIIIIVIISIFNVA